MESIQIYTAEDILAHHTVNSTLSHYNQPVWVIEDEDPDPGRVTWKQGEREVDLDILCVKSGWLIVKQPDGFLCGIIWSDGTYFSNVLENAETGPHARNLWKQAKRSGEQFSLTQTAAMISARCYRDG